MKAILIGMPGSGKSAVGKELAKLLPDQFLDLDDCIEEAIGAKISEFFVQHGEKAFRELETSILKTSLQKNFSVLSLGGGTVVAPVNQTLLQQQNVPIVWLRARRKLLLRRIAHGNSRPLFSGDNPEEVLNRLLVEREPQFQSLSDLTVWPIKNPAQTAQEVLKQLTTLGEK